MENATPVDSLRRAVDSVSGQSALADLLTKRGAKPVSQAMVWNWINRDKKAPAEHCPDIEAITGVKCEELRPDVNWSVLRGKPRRRGMVRNAEIDSSLSARLALASQA